MHESKVRVSYFSGSALYTIALQSSVDYINRFYKANTNSEEGAVLSKGSSGRFGFHSKPISTELALRSVYLDE